MSLVSIKNATANLKLIIMTKQQNYGTSIIVLFRFSSSNFFILHSLLKLWFGHGHTKNWWSVQLFSNQQIPQQRNFLNEIVLLDFWSYKSNMFWFYNQKCHYTYLSCYLKKTTLNTSEFVYMTIMLFFCHWFDFFIKYARNRFF